ncbi:MAG: hypothetical protein EHM47_00880 [Ignavibacteriales bacterium]|nr:MAG: hypothetical protein EHM47_00880 [Ignavibacteriales bacterium]
MTFQEPTYEEYKTATSWAKFKYKYGIIVIVLCWLCLLFICYYMFTNGEAIASNPFVYGAEKAEVECYCYQPNNINRIEFYFNSSGLWSGNPI